MQAFAFCYSHTKETVPVVISGQVDIETKNNVISNT